MAAFLFQKQRVNFLIAKKIVHVTAISITAISPYYVPADILIWIALLLTLINFILTYLGLFEKLNTRKNWGVFYFSASFTLLIYFFPDQPDLVFYPMIILALADGFAAIIGSKFGKHKYSLRGEVKSIEGSIVFFLVTVFCFLAIPTFFSFAELNISLPSALFISLFLTILEAQAIKERDNFWIPLAALYWLLLGNSFFDFQYVVLTVSFTLIVYAIYKFKWLSASGALTTWLLGCILVVSPKPVWVVPALVFLALGSIISKLPQMDKQKSEGGRNGQQVFCNGGIYTLLIGWYFISGDLVFLLAGMASITVAMSDTASSELGRRYGTSTLNILNFKKVPPGLSGGITFIGTVSGLIFAAAMAGLPFLILTEYTLQNFLIVFAAGFIGNIADSLIGAIFQIKYRPDANTAWSDMPVGKGKNETKGIEWITNNTVNLLATTVGAIIVFLVLNLF